MGNPANSKYLIPRQKGQGALPGSGRPKGSLNFSTVAAKILKSKMVVTDPVSKNKKRMSVLEQMAWKQVSKALSGDQAATVLILDRTEGKTPESFVGEIGLTKKEEFDLKDEQTRELLKQLYIRQSELSGTCKD